MEAKARLKRDTTWLTGQHRSAAVLRKACPVVVLVHGIQVAHISTSGWSDTKTRLKQDERRLNPNLEIVKMQWLSNA